MYISLATGDMAQRAYRPWERELENRSCSPLSCFSLPPLLQLPTLTETILMAENSLRKKESNYPSVSSVTWISLLMAWRRAGEGTSEENGQGRTGPSLWQKLWDQHSPFCLPRLHLPAILAALLPKHHQCIFLMSALISNLWVGLPITYQ